MRTFLKVGLVSKYSLLIAEKKERQMILHHFIIPVRNQFA